MAEVAGGDVAHRWVDQISAVADGRCRAGSQAAGPRVVHAI